MLRVLAYNSHFKKLHVKPTKFTDELLLSVLTVKCTLENLPANYRPLENLPANYRRICCGIWQFGCVPIFASELLANFNPPLLCQLNPLLNIIFPIKQIKIVNKLNAKSIFLSATTARRLYGSYGCIICYLTLHELPKH